MKALIIGATGATGRDVVAQLLEDNACREVHVFVRHDTGIQNPKLHTHIVDYERMDTWSDALQGDVLFSALGTTLKQAGSQKAQWTVDYTYQHEAAKAARANGVETMVLVSSAMASAKSRIFYTRMKGQLEEDIKKLAFESLTIVRPPSLIRKDSDRFSERLSVKLLQSLNAIGLLRAARPMPTAQVAHAMITAAKERRGGVQTLEPRDLWSVK